MRILHLSDTHVRRETGPDARGVDARESLRRILHDCAEIPGLDALLLTGDVADDGSREAYADVRDLLGTFSREQGIPAYVTTGNHDERLAFTQVLGTGHADRPITHLESADGERAAVSIVRGVRIVTLDSLVPGKGYGHLSRMQLDWLRTVLAESAPHGTVLAFHHPPIHVPGVAVQQALALQNPADLAAAVAGTDVRLLLCGHFHLQLAGALGGIPVWVTPGVVNRVDLTAAAGTERTVRGASASVVDLPEDGPPLIHTVHARDPRAGATLHHADAVEVSEIIAKLGPEP